jgi:transcriptional regulator with XRE-family HTH domain
LNTGIARIGLGQSVQSQQFAAVVAQVEALGQRISVARRVRGLSQSALADLAGVGLSTVTAIEGGRLGVSVGNVLSVLDALGLLGQVEAVAAHGQDQAFVDFALRLVPRRV